MAIFFLGTICFFVYINQPAKGKVKFSETSTTKNPEPEVYKYMGERFSFDYSSKYKVEKVINTNVDVIENMHLVGGAGVPQEIVVTLKKTGNTNLDSDSGVVLRRLKNSEYEEDEFGLNDMKGVIFDKKDGTETTVFVSAPEKILTASIVKGQKEELVKLLESVIIKD